MRKLVVLAILIAVFSACEKNDPVADVGSDVALKSQDMTGNGAPSGPHYTLNLIGVDAEHAKKVDMNDNSGHRIFVLLDGHSKIELIEGDDFAVLDANASDGSPAQFQLPDPELDPYFIYDNELPDIDYWSAYSVYIRPLGKPGGSATITTCADLLDSPFMDFLSRKYQSIVGKVVNNEDGYFGGIASLESVALALPLDQKGKPRFENVTAEMLTIVISVTITYETGELDPISGEPITESVTELIRVPIFDEMLEGEYWDVDNDGLKVMQIRFYPGIQTDVRYADEKFLN